MALKKNRFQPEDIKIVAIHIPEFIVEQREYYENPSKLSGYDIEMEHETAYNDEHYAARFRLFFNIRGKNNNNEPAGVSAKILLEFHFKLDNGEKYFIRENGNTKINLEMAANLLSVAYATARGIILQLTLPSALGGVILPVMDAAKWIKENQTKN